MTRYQVDNICYSSAQEAIEAISAKTTGQIVQIGNAPYRVDTAYVAPSSIRYDGIQLNGTGTFTKIIPITPEPCNLPDYLDGITLAWAVVAVWIAAYAITVLRRAL